MKAHRWQLAMRQPRRLRLLRWHNKTGRPFASAKVLRDNFCLFFDLLFFLFLSLFLTLFLARLFISCRGGQASPWLRHLITLHIVPYARDQNRLKASREWAKRAKARLDRAAVPRISGSAIGTKGRVADRPAGPRHAILFDKCLDHPSEPGTILVV